MLLPKAQEQEWKDHRHWLFGLCCMQLPVLSTNLQLCCLLVHKSSRQYQNLLPAGDTDGAAIEMAFSKKRIEERKQWLRDFVPGTFLDQSGEDVGFEDFINRVQFPTSSNDSPPQDSFSAQSALSSLTVSV